MRVFFQIGWMLIGLIQFFAVWDGVIYAFDFESFFSKTFAFMIAVAIAYTPILGSLVGIYGAVNAWEWSLIKAVIVVGWPIIFFVGFIVYAFVSEKRNVRPGN